MVVTGSLSLEMSQQLAAAKAAAMKSLNVMHQRWEFNTPRLQFLLVAANMPKDAWDISKYKIAKKYVKSLLKKSDEAQYLMIFGGSSCTASHDNYYNQSFPFVCERRMKSAFDALNISLVVHNIAHGQNPCRPSNLCYNGMGGDNADWMGWEQSYNCGRDRGAFELMARLGSVLTTTHSLDTLVIVTNTHFNSPFPLFSFIAFLSVLEQSFAVFLCIGRFFSWPLSGVQR